MKRTLAAMVLTVFAVGVAPSSYAEPGDASFVQQLSAAGVNITDPASLVGNTGRTICSLLEANWTVGTASYSVLSEYPFLSESQARTFVLLAHKNYCPNV